MEYLLCGAVEETVEQFVMEWGRLKEIRGRYEIGRVIFVEEVLLFGGRTEKRVESNTKMLEQM